MIYFDILIDKENQGIWNNIINPSITIRTKLDSDRSRAWQLSFTSMFVEEKDFSKARMRTLFESQECDSWYLSCTMKTVPSMFEALHLPISPLCLCFTDVYVQIKQISDGQILKKEKTPRFPLSENVFFPKSSFSFMIPTEQRNSITFTVSIKTQKYFFSLKKLVIGRTVIGPFSDGKWYKDFLREKHTDLEHSLHLKK